MYQSSSIQSVIENDSGSARLGSVLKPGAYALTTFEPTSASRAGPFELVIRNGDRSSVIGTLHGFSAGLTAL
jgi:hypothetical protein